MGKKVRESSPKSGQIRFVFYYIVNAALLLKQSGIAIYAGQGGTMVSSNVNPMAFPSGSLALIADRDEF